MLNKNWRVQLEVSSGNDIATWDKAGPQVTPAACVIWTSNDGGDAVYPCQNGLNDQKFGWNNLQQSVITWYHKINEHWHTDSEFWYMWEKDTPNVLNPQGSALISAQFPSPQFNIGAPAGAQCASATPLYCTSHEWAILNYLNYQIDVHNIWTWRSEFFSDTTGQRTGFKGNFVEFDLGYTHWVGDALELRPEVRLEREISAPNASLTGFAYNNPCYEPLSAGPTCTLPTGGTLSNTGGSRNQALFAADAIFHF
jgi:hypothetical protein